MDPKMKLRRMIYDNNYLIRAVGAHNALGAKIIENIGFDAVWASGFEISAAHAKPDANILTMTEFLYSTSQMAETTNLPIIADCDTGFGNVNNVIRMVKEYEKAGVSAICIEDKLFPKVNSFIPNRQTLISIDEFSGKIKAAKDTQKDSNLVVIARTEALIAGHDMNEALERAFSYREAGADMILIHSKQTQPNEVLDFCSQWKYDTPVVIVPTTYSTLNISEIKKHRNIKMVIYANQSLRAAVKAMQENLSALKISGELSSITNNLASMEEIFDIQGFNKMLNDEENYKSFVSLSSH